MPAHAEAVEAVSEILDRVGYNGIAVELPLEGTEHLVKAYLPYDHLARVKVRQVRTALGHLQAFGLGPIGAARVRRLDEEDWLESWKASFTPMRIGRFVIRPSWAPREDPGDALLIELDPGMAFGTGLHPTTRQCLEMLSGAGAADVASGPTRSVASDGLPRLLPPSASRQWAGSPSFPSRHSGTRPLDIGGASVLDVGTGSGILAIAAGRLGAARIVAVDVDEIAVEAARENCARNGVRVEVTQGSAADVAGTFDLVIANIVADTLRAIAGDLRARLAPGGRLLVAGVIAEKEEATREALGLTVVDRAQHDDWVAMLLE